MENFKNWSVDGKDEFSVSEIVYLITGETSETEINKFEVNNIKEMMRAAFKDAFDWLFWKHCACVLGTEEEVNRYSKFRPLGQQLYSVEMHQQMEDISGNYKIIPIETCVRGEDTKFEHQVFPRAAIARWIDESRIDGIEAYVRREDIKFEHQVFSRAEIARWIDENHIDSKYYFDHPKEHLSYEKYSLPFRLMFPDDSEMGKFRLNSHEFNLKRRRKYLMDYCEFSNLHVKISELSSWIEKLDLLIKFKLPQKQSIAIAEFLDVRSMEAISALSKTQALSLLSNDKNIYNELKISYKDNFEVIRKINYFDQRVDVAVYLYYKTIYSLWLTDLKTALENKILFVYDPITKRPVTENELKNIIDIRKPDYSDPASRLQLLRKLGGDVVFNNKKNLDEGFWVRKMKELKIALFGTQRSSEKTIKEDLKTAIEAELEKKREGKSPNNENSEKENAEQRKSTPYSQLGQRKTRG